MYSKFKGTTLKECIDRAISTFKVPKEKLKYSVIQEGKKGFIGIGKKPWIIKSKKISEQPKKKEKDAEEDIKSALNISINGYHKIITKRDGIFLTIFPPKGNGIPVDTEKLNDELKMFKIEDKIYDEIDNLIVENEKGTIRIADWIPNPQRDGIVEVSFEDNNIKCFIEIKPPREGGMPVEKEDIIKKLETNKIISGYNEDEIDTALKKKQFNKKILVKEGQDYIPGKNGYIDHKFTLPEEKILLSEKTEDGAIDYKTLDLIENVVVGQVLGEIIPSVPGKPGIDVFNNTINPPAVTEAKVILGPNVELSENQKEIISTIDGQVTLSSAGKISVLPIYEVKGHVDYHTGNISFLGSVIVRGNILPNFSVKATGNIEIYGTVEQGILEAEGDIIVKNGIVGKSEDNIYAEGDIIAKFIEGSNIRANGNVIVSEAIIHSMIDAGNNIIVNGKRAVIVGGKLRATNSVRANTIGTLVSTPTSIEVGVNPVFRQRLQEINNDRRDTSRNLDKILKGIKTLEVFKKKNRNVLPREKQEIFEQLKNSRDELKEKLDNYEDALQQIELELNSAKTGMVSVYEKVHNGTKIIIGNMVYHIKDVLKNCTFLLENSEIVTTIFREIKIKDEK